MPKRGIYYYKYYCVCGNFGHILLHDYKLCDYVVESNSWLMPLVELVIIIFAISHVTFITKMGK
jgi:hypothetical protein